MKKTITFLLVVLILGSFTGVGYAQSKHGGHGHYGSYSQSSLTLFMQGNDRFWVFVDDILQNEHAYSSITITGLPVGWHYVSIEMDNASHNSFGQYVYVNNAIVFSVQQHSNLFGLEAWNGAYNPVFNSNYVGNGYYAESMPGHVPSSHMNIEAINAFGNLFQQGLNAIQQMDENFWDENGHGYHQGQGGYGHNYPGGQPNGQVVPVTPSTPVVVPVPTPAPLPMSMDQNDFTRAYDQIAAQDFDNTRLDIAKQVASSNILSVDQIVSICRLFTFDKDKLEFAKFAYAHCGNPNQYYLVNDCFDFDSAKRELNEFLKNR